MFFFSHHGLQVEYEIPDEHLHTKLFAKIPHSMEKAQTDCASRGRKHSG